MNKLTGWITDHLHAVRLQARSFKYRRPPEHYLSHVVKEKCPIILIPGVLEKWQVLKHLGDVFSLEGHPVYAVERLGYNTRQIPHSARIVRELIDEQQLQNVVIIAHSKGGLIGKYILSALNKGNRVQKVLAIATPFGGSSIVRFLPLRFLRELHPESSIVRQLLNESESNKRIVSIYGMWDNHIWPTSSCHLTGAEKNVEIPVHGHHAILSHVKTLDAIQAELT